ncbi:hypothetical protein [Serratia nevei]|uniref:hypothetical protein n=1 Tax=Serratia nevei TaxID=2703794 RepID=UPI003FA7F00F
MTGGAASFHLTTTYALTWLGIQYYPSQDRSHSLSVTNNASYKWTLRLLFPSKIGGITVTQIVVRTKEELEKARKERADYIIVEGELADKLKKGKKVAKASGVTITVIAAAIAAAPFTGGISTLGAASAAALTGTEIVAIIAAASIGIALIIGVFKDYEEIEVGPGTLKLKRRQQK